MAGFENPDHNENFKKMNKNTFEKQFEALHLSRLSPEERAIYDAELKKRRIKELKKRLRDLEYEEKKRELQRQTDAFNDELNRMRGNIAALMNQDLNATAAIGIGSSSAGVGASTGGGTSNAATSGKNESYDPNKITVKVKTTDGKYTEISVNPSMNVGHLKNQISMFFKLKPKDIIELFLVENGDLKDEVRSLSYFEIQNGTVITCIIKYA